MEIIEKISIDFTQISITPKIDRQHAELLILVNNLIDEYRGFNNPRRLAEILSHLTDYGQEHFKEEEKWMEERNYPLIKGHIKSHQDYIYKIAMFNYTFFEAGGVKTHQIVSFISQWWRIHLLEWDAHLSLFGKEAL